MSMTAGAGIAVSSQLYFLIYNSALLISELYGLFFVFVFGDGLVDLACIIGDGGIGSEGSRNRFRRFPEPRP